MYKHTQRSPLHLLLYLPVAFAFVIAWQIRQDALPSMLVWAVGAILLLVSLSFQTLAITSTDDNLIIRYGPLNIFGTRLAFRNMNAVETGKTSVIDGWGIHFIPFRGWTFNLWGFECVKIKMGNKTIRVGTDDSENLAHFLRSQLNADHADTPSSD